MKARTDRPYMDRAVRTGRAAAGIGHACPDSPAELQTRQGLREGDRDQHWAETAVQEAADGLDGPGRAMQSSTSDRAQWEAVRSLVQRGAGQACSARRATEHHQEQRFVRPCVEETRSS